MNLRVKQKELSLEMLRALQENKLALCEAEVGTGKTHAYILALTVHNIYSDKKIPAVISTSTIALQKSLTEEYIPQISGILLEHHVIDVMADSGYEASTTQTAQDVAPRTTWDVDITAAIQAALRGETLTDPAQAENQNTQQTTQPAQAENQNTQQTQFSLKKDVKKC